MLLEVISWTRQVLYCIHPWRCYAAGSDQLDEASTILYCPWRCYAAGSDQLDEASTILYTPVEMLCCWK